MNLTEKSAYISGYCDGMELDKDSKEGKVIAALTELISEMAVAIEELEVVKTDPGFAGNTATNTLKPATLETGAEIKVPLFINEGDVLKIDTRTGEYLSRA